MLYAPANLLPILETSTPFGSQRDTIMSGIKFLWSGGAWPLALVILIASILIPLAKLLRWRRCCSRCTGAGEVRASSGRVSIAWSNGSAAGR